MEQTSTKKPVSQSVDEVKEGNGLWPYRVVEADRITYFKSKSVVLDYQEKSDGSFEFYVLPRWYSV